MNYVFPHKCTHFMSDKKCKQDTILHWGAIYIVFWYYSVLKKIFYNRSTNSAPFCAIK